MLKKIIFQRFGDIVGLNIGGQQTVIVCSPGQLINILKCLLVITMINDFVFLELINEVASRDEFSGRSFPAFLNKVRGSLNGHDAFATPGKSSHPQGMKMLTVDCRSYFQQWSCVDRAEKTFIVNSERLGFWQKQSGGDCTWWGSGNVSSVKCSRGNANQYKKKNECFCSQRALENYHWVILIVLHLIKVD